MSELKRNITSRDDEDALKNMASLYNSRYITVDDIAESGPVTMKIKHVKTEKLESIMLGKKKLEGSEKGVLEFDRPEGKKREIILNKTSFKELKHAWGLERSKWIGSTVRLELGNKNGKEYVLVSPVMNATANADSMGKASSAADKQPNPLGTVADDDLSFPDEEIPEDQK